MKMNKTLSIILVIAFLLVPAHSFAEKETPTPDPSTEEAADLKWIGTVKITSGNLNIRKGPSTHDEILDKLSNGSKVEVIEQLEEWAKIQYNHIIGYVSKQFLVIQQGNIDIMASKNKIVVLDPGHGGRDPGAITADGTYESKLVWQYTVKTKALLEKSGYTVFLTRGEKNSCTVYRRMEQELTCRVNFAEKVKADIYISIHADSNENKKFRGTVVFYNARNDYDGNQNHFSADSKRLAQTIHSFIQPAIGSKDRGLQNKNYFVNRMNKVPSILIELGFLTNSADLKLLKDKGRQDKFSASFVKAVDLYFAASGS
ncbi:MAG TPA: N-acetylmuramoyl-L-alanine amidase [Bacilli bacterium]